MKYKLTAEAKMWCGHVLHRIEATEDFNCVKAGELGGWIESEKNLSQDGNAWVSGNARVTFQYREDSELGSTDHTVFKNCWSSYRDFFYNAQTRLWSVGCFLGTSEELCRKAYADSEKSGDGYSKYIKFAEMFLDGDHVDVEAIKKEVLENETNEDA